MNDYNPWQYRYFVIDLLVVILAILAGIGLSLLIMEVL